MEYDWYLKILTETLYWFRNLSPSVINNFDENNCENLLTIVSGLDDSFLLLHEMKQLAPTISNCSDIREIATIFKNNSKFCPPASLVYQFMLTLPTTIASNERSFSKLKLIKNYLRSTMNNDRLFYLLISSIEYDLLDGIDIQKLVDDRTKMNSFLHRFISFILFFVIFSYHLK